MENVALWNLAGKRWQKSPTCATRLVTEMYKCFFFWTDFTCIICLHGRESCDFQDNTDNTCTDGTLMFFAAFLTRNPAKVWLSQTQFLPGKEWCCDLFCNLGKAFEQWWQTKNIPSNAVSVSRVYERIFLNLALLNRSSGFCKNQQILCIWQWQQRLAAFPSMWLLPGGLKFLWTNTSRLEPSKHFIFSLILAVNLP